MSPPPSPTLTGPSFPRQLRKLRKASRALTFATSHQGVVDLTVRHATRLLGAEGVVLMLMDDEGILRLRATHGVDEPIVARLRDAVGTGLVRQVRGVLGGADEGFLAVPLVARGRVVGVLAALRPDGPAYAHEEEWLLSTLADQAAVALENARMEQEIRRSLEDQVRAMENANKVKEKALATLGHDLRSPLHAIESYARLLEMEALGPLNDRQRDAVERVRVSGRHILALVENTVDMARLSAGMLEIERTRVEADAIIREGPPSPRPTPSPRTSGSPPTSPPS